MKLQYIIFITSLIYFTTAEIHEQTLESNNENGKAVTSSYTYSIEYADNNNQGKYGHKIEVKDGSAKVNVHSQHPKSVQLALPAQHDGFQQVQQKAPVSGVPQHQQQPAHVSYVPATNAQESHAQYQQKLKLPASTDPKLPIPTFDQQQLALLLTQNKNPFLPMIPSYTKQNNQIPHHQQVLSSPKPTTGSLTQSQPQKVTYYVPQPTPSYTKPQEPPTYSKQIFSYPADPKYSPQGVTYQQENGLKFEESPKMLQYQYDYSQPQSQLYYQPVQYMQLGATQPKSSYPNYNNYYNIPLSSGLSGSSEMLGHSLQYTIPTQGSPVPHVEHQNIQHYQTAQPSASGETSHAASPQYYENLPQISNQHTPQYNPQTVLHPSIQYQTSAASNFGYSQDAQVPQFSQQSGGHQVGPVQFLPQAQGQPQGHSLSHLFVKPQGPLPAPPNNQNHFAYQQAPSTNKAPQISSYPANLFTSGQFEYVYPGQKQHTEGAASDITGKTPSFTSFGSNSGHFGNYLPSPVGKPQIASASQEATKYINLPVQNVQPSQGNSYHYVNVQGYKPTTPVDKIPYKDSNTFNYNQLDFQSNKNIIYTPQHFNNQQNHFKTQPASSPKQQNQHQTIEHKLVLNTLPTQPNNYYSHPIADGGYKTETPAVPAATEHANQQIKYIYVPSYNANQAETTKGK